MWEGGERGWMKVGNSLMKRASQEMNGLQLSLWALLPIPSHLWVKSWKSSGPPFPLLSQSLFKLMSIELMMPSNHLILCHPLLLLPSVFLSIRVFSKGLTLRITWPKYWSISFSISLSNEYLGLSFFKIDWFDLLAFQGTLKSLLQHHNLKPSVLWHLVFFMVQLSHLYVNTGKNLALTIWTLVAKGEINAFFSSCS